MYYKNFEFDLDNKIKENCLKIFDNFLKYVRTNDISYIEILDKDQGYIFIKKEGEPSNEWNFKTIQMCNLLNILGFDAFLSEEDYGYIDVIVLNNIW